jgi:prevent-host-death family protein
MHPVGIKTLKNKLSEYLRAVAAGETVLVTDRGRLVAELIPPRACSGESPAQQRMGELVRQGLVTPAKVSPKARLPRRKPVADLATVLRELEAGRAER